MTYTNVKPTNPKFQDLEGLKFNRWTVLSYRGFKQHPSGAVSHFWACRCDCGNTDDQSSGALVSNGSKSCGCFRNEVTSQRSLKHGGTAQKMPEYYAWKTMRARCANPNNRDYPYYGGRGIRVCERWQDFANFLADVGRRPAGCTLDRVENDGDYEPGNVRWATRAEQGRNQRSNHLITYLGETRCIVDWATHFGIPRHQIHCRLSLNWPLNLVFDARVHPRSRAQSPERKTQQLAASKAVDAAIRAGQLARPVCCESCTKPGRIDGHHHLGYDPEHWLDVQWLCVSCHMRAEFLESFDET